MSGELDQSVKFLYLSQEDVIAAGGLDMVRTLEDIAQVLSWRDKGECKEPSPPIISWEQGEHGRRFVGHPAWVGGDINAAGFKWVAGYPENPFKYHLPRGSSIIVLNDATTGLPVAIMDGTIITAMRAGAVAGVAAKHLARGDSSAIGLVGAGVQSRTQALALKLVLPKLQVVKIYDLVPERSAAWAEEMAPLLKTDIRIMQGVQEVVEGSDVIVSATAGANTEPAFVQSEWFAEGCLYSVLSPRDVKAEVIEAFDRVVLTTREDLRPGPGRMRQLSELYGKGLLKDENIAELGEIINGKKPGRRNQRERIFLRPTGLSVEDVITAHRIYKLARSRGLGQELDLWRQPKWV